ncbi:PASTA domain-containing protein [Saccharomonospora sp.]|uniref:PASTA domain-containing protein n=1 Tax=Saccharomonospora sp. TaxID=33913 RepID=UPI00260795EF|nr:PASTA domain-containing protein [Saccharomonospora sp.]
MRAIHRRFCSIVIGIVGIVILGVGACLPLRAVDADSTAPPPNPTVMPSLRGIVLGDGEDALRALGIGNISAVPIDGHMFVFNDDNWVVLRQTPRAGETIDREAEVTLGVRKTREAESRFCFDGDC